MSLMKDANKSSKYGRRQVIQTCLIVFLLIISAGSFSVTECEAMLIFHKPAYTGRIVDMETKEPLEGVVVVTVYQIDAIIGGPAGGWSKDIHAKEALTDKDGIFHIPSYTTLIGLNSTPFRTKFIIFKPGYASYPWQDDKIIPFKNCFNDGSGYFPPHCRPDAIFSKETGVTGEIYTDQLMTKKVMIQYGIVELQKLNTWEERHKAVSVPGTGDFSLPTLEEIVNKENEWLMHNQGWRR